MRAMILAAGRGERMRPLTDTLPKPLLQVGGKPLIVWHLERLARAGFKEVVINHAWLGHLIESTIGSGHQYGLSIRYSAEAVALETAGGIATALPLLGEDPFLVINGDVWCDWDVSNAIQISERLIEDRLLGWLLLVPNPSHHPNGDFGLDQHSHASESALPRFTFSGIGVYHPQMFDNVQPGQPAKLAPVLRNEMSARRIMGHLHQGTWMDIGTPQRLHELDEVLRSGQ